MAIKTVRRKEKRRKTISEERKGGKTCSEVVGPKQFAGRV
jgi:hypothetical protein